MFLLGVGNTSVSTTNLVVQPLYSTVESPPRGRNLSFRIVVKPLLSTMYKVMMEVMSPKPTAVKVRRTTPALNWEPGLAPILKLSISISNWKCPSQKTTLNILST